jgi:hypothetical protein
MTWSLLGPNCEVMGTGLPLSAASNLGASVQLFVSIQAGIETLAVCAWSVVSVQTAKRTAGSEEQIRGIRS